MLKITTTSFHIAENINIKAFKQHYTGKMISSSNTELFYYTENKGYLYLFLYGGVVFYNFTDLEMTQILSGKTRN